MTEEWTDEFISLETELTIFELMLLLKIATLARDQDMHEPIGMTLAEQKESPLELAPFLHETTLLQLAQQKRLLRLRMIELEEDFTLSLTDKGVEAAKWWAVCLKDIQEGSL